jgi:hypothetical protein
MARKVQVYARIKPLEESKIQAESNTVKIRNERNVNETLLFTFDGVFDGSCTQKDVFGKVRTTIDDVLKGNNATIFAYGQTGAGSVQMREQEMTPYHANAQNRKTHSILGSKTDPGLLPRIVEELLSNARPGVSSIAT